MTPSRNTPEQTSPPIPSLYTWLRRTGRIAVILMVVLVPLLLWWMGHAHRVLQREIDRIIVAEPLLCGHCNSGGVPPEANAALMLDRATRKLGRLTRRQNRTISALLFQHDHTTAQKQIARSIALDHLDAVQLVHQARLLKHVEWDDCYCAPFWGLTSRTGGSHRRLARVGLVSALDALHQGTMNESIELLIDQLAYASALDQRATISDQLLSSSVRKHIARIVERILPHIHLQKHGRQDQEVARNQLEALARHLLTDEGLEDRLTRGLLIERMRLLAAARHSDNWSSRGMLPIVKPLLRPMRELDLARVLRRQALWIMQEDVITPIPRSWTSYRSGIGPRHLSKMSGNRRLRRAGRAIERYRENARTARHAGLCILITLFVHDHGYRPPSLDALVPHYIAEIPIDPSISGTVPFVLADLELPEIDLRQAEVHNSKIESDGGAARDAQ